MVSKHQDNRVFLFAEILHQLPEGLIAFFDTGQIMLHILPGIKGRDFYSFGIDIGAMVLNRYIKTEEGLFFWTAFIQLNYLRIIAAIRNVIVEQVFRIEFPVVRKSICNSGPD